MSEFIYILADSTVNICLKFTTILSPLDFTHTFRLILLEELGDDLPNER